MPESRLAALEKRLADMEEQLSDGEARMEAMEKEIVELSGCIQQNTAVMQTLSTQLATTNENTSGLVEAWKAGTGALKVVKFISKYIMPTILAIWAAWHFLKDTFTRWFQ